MNTNLPTRWSFGLFLATVVIFLVVGVLLEGVLNSFSTAVQRILMIALIVLPAGLGTLAGILSFFREPRRILLSLLAVLLNGLTFLFFAFLVSFAG